jgi:hypothetical protein
MGIMKRLLPLALLLALLIPGSALAQSGCPSIIFGAVLTAGQWNACFAAKQDMLGYTPLNLAGGTMSGKLTTSVPTSGTAGFNLPHGTAPLTPVNGDVWTTTLGAFVQINGVTVQFAGTAASTVLSVSNSDGTLTISPTTGAVVASIALGHSNTWTAQQTLGITQNAGTSWQVSNVSAGTSALAFYNASNGTSNAAFGIGGTGYTVIPILQNRNFINADAAAAGIILNNQGANPIIFAISNTEVGRWDTSAPGQLFLGLANTTGGKIAFFSATSGSIVVTPPGGALGSVTNTLQAVNDTFVYRASTDAFTNKTFDTAGAGNVFKINGTQITTVTGTGAVVLANTPTLITPVLGVATGTSLALGGGSIGSDALEVTGTTTHNGSITVTGGTFIMSGAIASAAWTTSGIRFRGVPTTFTDTTSSGTVAAAYTDAFGGNTIAASNPVTFTNYVTLYVKAPVQGTNVTFTNAWALGADSLRIGTSNQLTVTPAGALTVPGTATLQGVVTFGIPASAGAQISLANTTNSNLVGLAVPNGASAYTFSLPTNGGTTGQFLTSAGGATLTWDSISAHLTQGTGILLSGTTNVTVALATPVTVSNGGTGDATLAAHNLLLGQGTGAVTGVPPVTAGNLLVDQGVGNDPIFKPPSGDVASISSAGAFTFATVLTAGGPTGDATHVAQITWDAKGRLTAVTNVAITPAISSVTGLGTNVAIALGVNVGAAGAFVVNGGALGSPSSAGTLPAFTLGGTIAGGGNQINNVVIGASTPLAGSFTTATASTSVTSPIVAGGSAASSTLTLESTTGAGTTDSIIFQTGSQVFAGSVNTTQQWLIGTNHGVSANSLLTLNKNAAAPVASNGGTLMSQSVGLDATQPVTLLDAYGTGVASWIVTRSARGTAASFTALQSADGIGFFGMIGATGSNTYATNGSIGAGGGVFFGGRAKENWSSTNQGAALELYTTPLTTAAVALAVTVQAGGGVSVGGTTDPGVGGLYLNGQQFMPNITTSSAAQTGTVCWTTGTGKFTVDTTVGCLTSLEEAKDILAYLKPADALRLVDDLRPFSFRYRRGWGDSGHYEQFGLGARQVAAVDERMVGRDPDGALQGVRYQELTAVLVGAIKELKAANDNLHAEVARLRGTR